MKTIKEYTDMNNITSIGLYICEEKKNNINNFKIISEKYFFPLNNKNLLIYSEIPFIILTKNAVDIIEFNKTLYYYLEIKKIKIL